MKTPLKVTLIAITAVIVLVIGAIIYTINTRPQVSADDNASDALPGARSNSHVLDSAGPDAPTLESSAWKRRISSTSLPSCHSAHCSTR